MEIYFTYFTNWQLVNYFHKMTSEVKNDLLHYHGTPLWEREDTRTI